MSRRGGLPIAGLDLLGELPLQPVEDDTEFLRPRVRSHRRRSRRGFTGRAIVLLRLGAACTIAVAALWAGYARTMASNRLKVNRVDVRGSHFLSEGEVRELLGPAVGENILGLDIEGLKARLRASPWVADASVGRTLPDTLNVVIREREPLALAEVERLYLMDGEGGLIDIYGPRTASFDLPIVRGLAPLDPEARRDRAERAGTLLRDLSELAAEVSEVRVEGSGEIRVVLRGTGELLLLGAPPYRARVLTFLALRKELVERCPRAEYFDLRFRGRIFARQPPPPAPSRAPSSVTRPAAGSPRATPPTSSPEAPDTPPPASEGR